MLDLARQLDDSSRPRKPWPVGRDPLTVALVITELDVGGAEKALASLALSLDRSRWRPVVIALGPEAEMAAPIRKGGVEVVCLGLTARQAPLGVVRLSRCLRRIRPALVQSFLFHANVLSRLAVGLRLPLLNGIRVAEREQTWHLRADCWTQRLAQGAVCVSEGVRRFSRDFGGWPEQRLTVIPNAVDSAPIDSALPISRDNLGVPAHAALSLFVGRLNVQKGLRTLLDALESRDVHGRPLHLLIAGDGPQRSDLLDRVGASSRLSETVHFLGHRSDVPSLLKTADLFVLPSLWEGMPNAVLEAMAARLPVIATAVEGTEELVVPGETGWLVPVGDPLRLAQALDEAIADPLRLRRFGETARQRVDRDFTPERTALAYERLWAGLLGYDRPC